MKTNWYEKAVVYQVYPFSFMDSNNDGWGDIPGIISRLDYIRELGATSVWFSPLYDSPDHDYGYDIRDYRAIDPKFGTMEDFQRLLDACHQRDLKVIMDMVINHTSNEHTWFQQAIHDKNSPYRDYYIIREGIKKGQKLCPPTNWTSSFTGSAWEQIPGTQEYYLHLFTKEQPDLNWENPKVRQEIADILNYWLSMGVDGFRFDVFNLFSKVYPLQSDSSFAFQKGTKYFVDGPRIHEFLHELYEKALGNYDSFTVGESYCPNEEHAHQYVRRESGELDTIFHFEHLACDNLFNLKFPPKKFNLRQFKKGLFAPQIRYHQDAWNTLVLENHDVSRSNSRFSIPTDQYRYEASTLLPIITFMGFGTPFIYMGEEIGMTNMSFCSMDQLMDPVSHFVHDMLRQFHFPEKLVMRMINHGARDQARLPMQWDDSINAGFNTGAKPWQCVNPNYREINVQRDLLSDKSIFRFYQKLLKLKKENETAIYGTVQEFDENSRNMVVYSREWENHGLLIVGNFSSKKVSYRLPRVFAGKDLQELLCNYGTCQREGDILRLQPYEGVIFSY